MFPMTLIQKTLVVVLFSFISVNGLILSYHASSKLNQIDLLPTTKVSPSEYRLPPTLVPSLYQLRLFVVLDPLPGYSRFSATGDIAINVTCVEPTSEIYLHSVNLSISHETVKIEDQNGQVISITSFAYELLNDFFIITLNETLEKDGVYTISMHYTAPIPDYRLNGMYQDFYQDPETSETRYLATTLFAPYHARRLFPCFDEPALRAAYKVEIGHHKDYHAMANGEVLFQYESQDQPDYVFDVFETTPTISSYITAMIVSDFTFVVSPENRFSGKDIRIYAAPHLTAMGAGEYAANITDYVMAFLEDRFKIKYPIKKLYSIALPQFFFSAMENLGMITYKEPVLLYLKNETTEEERYTINSVSNHELSHQWLGNIVACRFWTWVWLKEGFSTFYSHYGINHTNPELLPWEMFVPKVLNAAMSFDSTNATHPMENVPVNSAAVANIYTAIPYSKGASVLRMTSSFLTENVFEEGIRIYIDRYQYSDADQNNLFDCLQEAVDMNPEVASAMPASVREIMNSWTLQSGFPILRASMKDSSHLELSQDAFGNSSKSWWVPVTLQPKARDNLPSSLPDTWIPQGTQAITIEVTTADAIIVNPQAIDYYRVLYDEILKSRIEAALNTDLHKISPSARAKLIDDYFQLALSGYESIEAAMNLTRHIHNDSSIGVWLTVKSTMEEILKYLSIIEDYDTADLLKEYLLVKIRALWNTFLSDKSDDNVGMGSTAILYETLIKWSSDLGSSVAFSKRDVANFMSYSSDFRVAKEKQLSFYCEANAEDKDSEVFNRLLRDFTNPKTLFGLKQRVLKALACTQNSQDLEWLLGETFNTESSYFTLSESGNLLQLLAKKEFGTELIIEKVTEHAELFFNRYDNYSEDILLDIAERSTKNTDQVMNLMDQYLTPERSARVRALLSHSEKRRTLLLESMAVKLRTWLKENSK